MKALFGLVFCLIAPADFSGSYKGDYSGITVQLELKQSGADLTGEAKVQGSAIFTLAGKVDGATASGKADFAGEKAAFRGTLSGEKFTLEIAEDVGGKVEWSESEKLVFERLSKGSSASEKPSGRLAAAIGKASPDGVKGAKAESSAILKDGKTYEHASGGRFKYPSNWSLQEMEEGIQLVPNDAATGEGIYIAAENAQGKTDPSDPEVLGYLDTVVQSFFPNARRSGKPEPARAGNGKGTVLTWLAGETMIRSHTAIIKNFGVSIVMVGSKAQVEKRTPQLRDIFFTFGWGQGKTDAKLVGSWQYYSYSQVSGRETKARARLGADGSFTYNSEREAASNLSGKDSLGNQTWTGWVNSRSGSGYKGTWVADGRTLYLNFEDGTTEEFDYTFEQQGTAFVLKLIGNDPKKPMEWSKIGN